MMKRDYLLEIGCEELPAGFVGPALWFGREKYDDVLKKARLSFDGVDIYGTPRRLTYIVRGLKTARGRPRKQSWVLRKASDSMLRANPRRPRRGLPGRRVWTSPP